MTGRALRLAELGHQLSVFHDQSESLFAQQFDTETTCLARYVQFTEPLPASSNLHLYPPDWNIDRSTLNRATREFLRLARPLLKTGEYQRWSSVHCNTDEPQPERPLGRTQSRSRSVSTSSNKQSDSQPEHELMTVEPEPTIECTPFDRSAVTPQGPPAELDDPPTVRPIHRSRSRSASLGRTVRQLFP